VTFGNLAPADRSSKFRGVCPSASYQREGRQSAAAIFLQACRIGAQADTASHWQNAPGNANVPMHEVRDDAQSRGPRWK
jgi:hypothetical protein